MPGISVVAVMEAQERHWSAEKLRRRSLRDASDSLAYPSSVFISYYRLNKEGFIMVLNSIKDDLKRSSIHPILQLFIALRFLATGTFQGAIAKDVDITVGRSTVSTLMWRVIDATERHICSQWITIAMSVLFFVVAQLSFFANTFQSAQGFFHPLMPLVGGSEEFNFAVSSAHNASAATLSPFTHPLAMSWWAGLLCFLLK